MTRVPDPTSASSVVLAQQPGHERGQARAAGAHLLLQNLRAVFDVGQVALTADAPEDACAEPVAAQDVEDSRHPAAVECGQERADLFDGSVGRGVPEPVEVRDRPADERASGMRRGRVRAGAAARGR